MIPIPFAEWLQGCARLALESEWCIDPAWPRWQELYEHGATVEEAVDALFKEIGAV